MNDRMQIVIGGKELDEAAREKHAHKCDRLTACLYYLMMDHVTVGQIEQVLVDVGDYPECYCTNRLLVELAEKIRKRILKVIPE